MHREPLERRLAPLMRSQHGVFTRPQALTPGATERVIDARLASGRWERVHRRVYRITGMPPSWRQALVAACLTWGPGAAASHRSAAALRLHPGYDQGVIEITVPRNRNRRRSDLVMVHRLPALPRADLTIIDGIPATSATRTIIDLASVAPADLVEDALDDALRRRLTSLARLRARLDDLGRRGRPGTALMRALLEQRDPKAAIPQSVFETRLLRALRRAGLPPPVTQHPVRDGRRLVAIVDFAYPAARIAIEAEGLRWHAGRARWARDLTRRNALTSLGWHVVHVTWHDLTSNLERPLDTIRRLLTRRRRTATRTGSSARR